ncbi:MAG: type II toxin-antitoxin system RelE/ParE family toxin [Gammaproteobacteria bacterium]
MDPSAHARKIRLELTVLETATIIEDMAVPGFHLYSLKGNRKGQWSITVSGKRPFPSIWMDSRKKVIKSRNLPAVLLTLKLPHHHSLQRDGCAAGSR